MTFIEYANNWSKNEVMQGRVMICFGLLLLLLIMLIFRSNSELLRGMLIPLGLLLMILVGYGSYILYSRPVHVKNSISLYDKSKPEAIEAEKIKHLEDNKAGKVLLKYIYPTLLFITTISLFFISSLYFKGIALGFILLFISIYIIDNGFVTRSDAFITFLNNL